MQTASVHVTKLAAAKRQLQAAIRLFFMREDELAVHTVASAAYGLLKDLKRDRGQSEAAHVFVTGIFYAIRDFRRGTLPPHFTSDPVMMAEIERLAEQLMPITADSKLSDVRVTIPPSLEKQYWNEANQAANFLKHADRDTDGILSLDLIDNKLILMKCCSAYSDVAPDDLENEGFVFGAFTVAANNRRATPGSAFDMLVELLTTVPDDKRLAVCHDAIARMNAR